MLSEQSGGSSRREFLRSVVGGVLAVAVSGKLLSESNAKAELANFDELHEFLERPVPSRESLGQNTEKLLSFLDLQHLAQVRWIHRADSKKRLDRFMGDEKLHVAEVDFRYNPQRDLYIGHDRGDRSDIDPTYIATQLEVSPRPKVIKRDCKDHDAVHGCLAIIDPNRPNIINADLLENPRFGLSPQALVDHSYGIGNVIISIGRNLHLPLYTEDMIMQYEELVLKNQDVEFTVPINILEFMSNLPLIRALIDLPRLTLTVYHTQGFALLDRHVKWIKSNVGDDLRSKTFFDL